MFDPARQTLGPLPPLHIYGMQPAAPFDEAYVVEAHAVVETAEWLHEKIAASDCTLDDPEADRFAVREIGPFRDGEALHPAGQL